MTTCRQLLKLIFTKVVYIRLNKASPFLPMTRKRIITSRVPPLHEAQRLDSYLSYRFTYLTEELWRKEILEGKLSLDGMPAFDPAAALKGGEMLAWDGSRIVEPEVDDRIPVLYEDEWFIAVNKPGNLPVHAAGRYFSQYTCCHAD